MEERKDLYILVNVICPSSHLGAAFFTMGIFFSHVILATFLSENASAFSNAPAALDAMGSFASGRARVTLG